MVHVGMRKSSSVERTASPISSSPTVQSERSRSTRLRRAPIPEPTSGGEWSVRAESPPREEIIARGRVAADGPRQFGTDGGDTVALAICRTRAGEGVEGGICRDGDAGESDLERNCGGGVLRCRRCLLTTESRSVRLGGRAWRGTFPPWSKSPRVAQSTPSPEGDGRCRLVPSKRRGGAAEAAAAEENKKSPWKTCLKTEEQVCWKRELTTLCRRS